MPTQLLTNTERRVIANLSIPRNAFDLERVLKADPASGAGNGQVDIGEALQDAIRQGWVASLGDGHENPGALAAAADSHQATVDLPDEKLHIYENRLKAPHRSWRLYGEQFMLTKEGFEALHQPVGDPTPLPTHVVQRVIDEHFKRVHQGGVEEGTRLASHEDPGDLNATRMLEDEFAAWAQSVAAAHEAATGEKVRLPIGGGAGYSDATELLILDPENGKGSAYTETAPWFMAAVTVAVTDADTGSTITEANYTGYARKSVAAADMNSAAAGSAANANAITFAACTGGTSAVIGHAKCAALTVGRLIKYGTCSTVNVSSTQTPLSFASGAFTTTLD